MNNKKYICIYDKEKKKANEKKRIIFQRKIKYRTEQQSSPNEMEKKKKSEAYTQYAYIDIRVQYTIRTNIERKSH